MIFAKYIIIYVKQIDFIFLCFRTVIDTDDAIACEEQKVTALDYVSWVLFCSSHAMTSSVIYYSIDARKSEIYLLNITLVRMTDITVMTSENQAYSRFSVALHF